MRRPIHDATTAQLGAAFPFTATPSLPSAGVLVGRDQFGGAFVHDPFELYRLGVITNPNMIVLGQIGRGKSAFVKTYLYRHAAFGRRVVVLDPKGEYSPLVEALGATPIALRPGGGIIVNPLAIHDRSAEPPSVVRQSRREIAAAIAAAALGRPLRPTEWAALELATDVVEGDTTATLGRLVEALIDPDSDSACRLGVPLAVVRRDSRDLALQLRRLVAGDLAGMFDGPTSPGIDLTGPVVAIDLSALYRSSAMGIVLACVQGALEATFRSPETGQTIVVIDEAWAVLSNVAAARFLQSSFKLARAFGVANLAVVHRISDLSGGADVGSVSRTIAEGLIADCETIVCYAQSATAAAEVGAAIGLGAREVRILTRLQRGQALWRVGVRSFVVEHRLAPTERSFVDTDARLIESRER